MYVSIRKSLSLPEILYSSIQFKNYVMEINVMGNSSALTILNIFKRNLTYISNFLCN